MSEIYPLSLKDTAGVRAVLRTSQNKKTEANAPAFLTIQRLSNHRDITLTRYN